MRLNIKDHPEFRFGFEGFKEKRDPELEAEKSIPSCSSGHGHCWVPGPTLLCYPPIHTYSCEHCGAFKKVQVKRVGCPFK